MVCDDGLKKSGKCLGHGGVSKAGASSVISETKLAQEELNQQEEYRCPHCQAWCTAQGVCNNPDCSRFKQKVTTGYHAPPDKELTVFIADDKKPLRETLEAQERLAGLDVSREESMRAYKQAMTQGANDESRLKASSIPEMALAYAQDVDEGPHPVTRAGVLSSPEHSLRYAKDEAYGIKDGPHPATRRAAARNPRTALQYALHVDNAWFDTESQEYINAIGPHPVTRSGVLSSPEHAARYAIEADKTPRQDTMKAVEPSIKASIKYLNAFPGSETIWLREATIAKGPSAVLQLAGSDPRINRRIVKVLHEWKLNGEVPTGIELRYQEKIGPLRLERKKDSGDFTEKDLQRAYEQLVERVSEPRRD
jgi:hypothetical protein